MSTKGTADVVFCLDASGSMGPCIEGVKSHIASFVDGLKRLANDDDKQYAPMMNDLMGQLEHSYDTRLGYWKGGTVSVFGYGGGVIPRFSQVAEEYPESKEFHTLRVQPPAGLHYSTDLLRNMCDVWEEHGSGLIALHGQSGGIPSR